MPSNFTKIASFVILLLMLATMVGVVYLGSSLYTYARFTEFYILNTAGQAYGLPSTVVAGERVTLIAVVANEEHENTEYQIRVKEEDETLADITPIIVRNGEEWRGEISFSPRESGSRHRIDLLLFRKLESEPYRVVYFWLDVKAN